jgi:hypothetical protein
MPGKKRKIIVLKHYKGCNICPKFHCQQGLLVICFAPLCKGPKEIITDIIQDRVVHSGEGE